MELSLYDKLKTLVTEKQNPESHGIDDMPIEQVLHVINSQDKTVPVAVEKEIPYIAKAVEIVVNAIKNGGRLIYIGAGTSGRLGVLDASEIPPTFGADPELVQGIIAGGYAALTRAQEGAEDKKEVGGKDLMKLNFTNKDVACGLTASRITPYVVGAIEKAKEVGAKTIYITCTDREQLELDVDVAICPVVGPEVVMGSTRMKSGTAEKLVLNMLTTTAMIRLGKVYNNMMVDLLMTSKKLEERSKRTVVMVTGVDYDTAAGVLKEADGHVKTAIVMILKNVDPDEAQRRLKKADGFVKGALK
ncbi:N-acetylmuramic acid 6-phosphate etherase [candidate division KSB1 bacterium]|nr:N-acetylmuramic acid 6-phosphate etherase [candidate division KSB1 bacterium]MBL7094121.1 N-acetylmuramic acid 6-phosphate etherase [candidate division KSB1 bacterium]